MDRRLRTFLGCWALVLAMPGILVGCGKKPNPGPETAPIAQPSQKQGGVENLIAPGASDPAAPPPAPGTVVQPEASAQPTVEKEEPVHPLSDRDVAMLNYAVSQFREAKGRNPTSLQELVQARFLPKIPQTDPSERLVYDSGTGRMKVEKIK